MVENALWFEKEANHHISLYGAEYDAQSYGAHDDDVHRFKRAA